MTTIVPAVGCPIIIKIYDCEIRCQFNCIWRRIKRPSPRIGSSDTHNKLLCRLCQFVYHWFELYWRRNTNKKKNRHFYGLIKLASNVSSNMFFSPGILTHSRRFKIRNHNKLDFRFAWNDLFSYFFFSLPVNTLAVWALAVRMCRRTGDSGRDLRHVDSLRCYLRKTRRWNDRFVERRRM